MRFIHLIGAQHGGIAGHKRLVERTVVAGSAGSWRRATATPQEPQDLRIQHVVTHGHNVLLAQVVVYLQEEAVVVIGAQGVRSLRRQAVETLDGVDSGQVIEDH